ncbi:hypothetical protein G6F46_005430 [Rhizopus delemar]|nr:hypothetical protein G6F53_004587 [Rhizopus delemar]KAG1597900.1 hypothetical protein G6F47_006907 [Rhizopus delemar]KAG1616448.1 hypothetical protein G6F46_005430 [Rhizopus delemar]KAG1640662.1 hypothetical protein G6F44_006605 [Rhizopus delemar]
MNSERDPLLQDRGIEDDENNEQENSRGGKFTFLEKVLFALTAIFFIVLCVFAGLYARRIYDEKPGKAPSDKPSPLPGNNKTDSLCLTPECVLTAAQILQDIDMTVDPCDDFYQYTCSKWESNHKIPDGKSAIGSFLILRDENKEALRDILSGSFDDFYRRTHSSSNQLPDPEKLVDKQNFNKAKSLYDSCKNESLIDARGAEPIYPLLKEIRQLLPASTVNSARELTKALSYLAKRGVGGLFEIAVDADFKDPSVNSLLMYQSGLTLPTKDYYNQDETIQILYETISETLDAVFADSGNEFGWTKFSANSTARMIVDFEKKLAKISNAPEYFQDPEGINNPMTLSELAKLSPSVDWGLYVNYLLPSAAPYPNQIIVTSPHYIGNMSELVQKESNRAIQAFLTWKAIYAYTNALSEPIREPIRRLEAKLVGSDPKSIRPRWDTCLDEVNDSIGFLVGRYYVLDKFGGDAKKHADDFVNSIKDIFLKRLPELSWIDDETREKAVEKVDRLIRKIGYPDSSPNVMSPISLLEYYSDLELKEDDYFGNYLNSRLWAIQEEWSQVGKAPEKKKWLMNPQEVNAYYNPSFNEIVFPAGILQNPFFGSNYPDYLNYGGIGVVVGHELTHGFDNNGRHFDADGKLVQWWTNETSAQFDEKASCFVKQYGDFTMVDENGKEIHVNGKLTLGENLADNGGLRESYLAWKQQYDSDKENKKYNNVLLPGLDGLSPEQLFFINFGRVWCNKATPAQAKKGVLTDEHSPPKWRVNGAVQNSEHFAKVFNCPAGSRMNPADKCELCLDIPSLPSIKSLSSIPPLASSLETSDDYIRHRMSDMSVSQPHLRQYVSGPSPLEPNSHQPIYESFSRRGSLTDPVVFHNTSRRPSAAEILQLPDSVTPSRRGSATTDYDCSSRSPSPTSISRQRYHDDGISYSLDRRYSLTNVSNNNSSNNGSTKV